MYAINTQQQLMDIAHRQLANVE